MKKKVCISAQLSWVILWNVLEENDSFGGEGWVKFLLPYAGSGEFRGSQDQVWLFSWPGWWPSFGRSLVAPLHLLLFLRYQRCVGVLYRSRVSVVCLCVCVSVCVCVCVCVCVLGVCVGCVCVYNFFVRTRFLRIFKFQNIKNTWRIKLRLDFPPPTYQLFLNFRISQYVYFCNDFFLTITLFLKKMLTQPPCRKIW